MMQVIKSLQIMQISVRRVGLSSVWNPKNSLCRLLLHVHCRVIRASFPKPS